MTDIVERLRDRAYGSKFPDPLLEEAADEIARLRGSTAEQRFCEPPVAGSTPAAGSLRDTFAAAALTGLVATKPDYREPDEVCRLAYEWAGMMLRERLRNGAVRGCETVQPATNHDAAPAARATADRYVRRAAADSRPGDGTGETLSKAEIDALQHVVEKGRFIDMSDYGLLRSLLVRLRPEWGSDRPQPVKDDVFDRPKPISDERLAALEQLSALDQELELKHGIAGNPMIKAQTNTAPEVERLRGQLAWTERERDSLRVSINNLRDYVAELNAELYAKSDEKRVLCDTKSPRNGALSGCETVPDPDSRVWETPCTPPTHATQPQGSVQGEGSVRDSQNANEPVAWAVMYPNGEFGILAFYRREAEDRATASDRVVPLYRSPTLTDAEQEAVEVCAQAAANCGGFGGDHTRPAIYKGDEVAATMRGLLERLK